jgi:hypothetical protein
MLAFFFSLIYFLVFKWTDYRKFLYEVKILPFSELWNCPRRQMNPYKCVLILFSCNFFGCVLSPASHRQFLLWYCFSIPFLVDTVNIPFIIKLGLCYCVDAGYYYTGPYLYKSVLSWMGLYPILFFLYTQEP